MGYEVNEQKSFTQPSAAVYAAALKAAAGLEGAVSAQKPDAGEFEIRFDKKILGNVLGDRTFMSVKVTSTSPTSSVIAIEAYPLDPVGRKLMFGARQGVTQTVLTWFFAHLDHHLSKAA